MNQRFSKIAFLLCGLFLLFVTFTKPRFLLPDTEATLAWDVSGYYLYLPALFIYNDLDNLAFLPGIIEKYQPSNTPDQAFLSGNDKMVMKYSIGMAVLYAPFFGLAHAAAKISGYPADGFSLPYQIGIHLGSVLVVMLGLWFLRKNLLRYFEDKTAGWTLILIVLGTNLLNYSTFDAANAHGYLFALMAALIHFTIRWHDKPTVKSSLAIGLCIGLAALVRPTEIIYALVPILWGITSWRQVGERVALLMKHLPKLVLTATVIGAIGFIQLAYWKMVAGEWIVYSYQDQGFSFLRPYLANVLFSYRKGWLVYTPLMLFALVGFYFLYKNYRSLFPTVFIYFLINIWIVSAWDIWWYGGGFGQRAMIQSYPLLAFPLAAFMAWAFPTTHIKHPISNILQPLLVLLLAACTALNLFQTYQAHWGPFETEAMTKAYYWRIFAKTKNDPWDRLLLDTKDAFIGKRKNVQLLQAHDFEAFPDTAYLNHDFVHSGKNSLFVDTEHDFSPPVNLSKTPEIEAGKWLHVSAWFYSPMLEYDLWQMPLLVVRFKQAGQPVRERNIRPFRVMQPNEWLEVGVDIRVPHKEFDTIEIFLWNPGMRVPMYMDDLKVELFE